MSLIQANELFSTGHISLLDRSVTPNQSYPIIALSDITVDFGFTGKQLETDQLFPIGEARVGEKITLKAKGASVEGALLAKILNGSVISGTTLMAKETFTIPTTPYQVTVANAAHWTDEAGVYMNHVKMSQVASSPVSGVSFTVAAGVYTFASGDQGKSVEIRYGYTATSPGNTASVGNSAASVAPTFEVLMFNVTTLQDGTAIQHGYRFYAGIIDKVSVTMKAKDYTELDIEMHFIPRTSDAQVYQEYTSPN